MHEEKNYVFSQETLDTFFEASLMRGITLDRLREKKEKYEAFIIVTLFYLKRVFCNKRPRKEDLIDALDSFLTDYAFWLEDKPEKLFECLMNAGGFEIYEGGYFKVLLKIEGQWTKGKAFSYLEEKYWEKEKERRAIREALQEKNRTVNSKKVLSDASRDSKFMKLALKKAQEAFDKDEVPVGAVLVSQEGEILSQTHNTVVAEHDATAHAEMLAIREASRKLKTERLKGTTLYVTLEPCPMCASAILHARISRVVWGADDTKAGALGGAMDLENLVDLNWYIDRKGGVLKEDCEKLINDFFRAKREKLKDEQCAK